MPREKRPDDAVALRLEIPKEARDRLMMAAGDRGQSMAACLRQFVMEWIDTNMPESKARRRRVKP